MNWQEAYLNGKLLLIDKPLRWTSFGVVKKVRILTKISKVGHAGTLDPLATGLLIVCTGKFTKRLNEYMAKEKEYTGTITLGAVTPTFDLESAPTDIKDISSITIETIREVVKKFTGPIEQIPPMHSAIKKDGVAAYVMARKGIEVKMEPRKVTIEEYEIVKYEAPLVHFRIVCTTGTYIRSLANDLGAALGCGGYLSSLCRTRIGEFLNADAMTVPQFEEEINRLRSEEGVI